MELHDFDFQIQTSASDGKETPAACVRMAKANGVSVIAITDHDTVSGVEEALAEGRALGVEVIPGIELSCEDHQIHLLGLGIDIENPALRNATAGFVAGRRERAQEMARRLAADGFELTWDDVMAEARGAVVARPHIVDAILKKPANIAKLGGPMSKVDFFREHFSDSSKYYVHHANISAKDAIALIHQAGGIAVWSHPPVPGFQGDCAGLEAFLKELLEWKLDGVEAFGPSLTQADAQCLDRLARQYSLLRTGGSDFHESSDPGAKPWPRSASTIGEFPAYGYETDSIVEATRAAIASSNAAYRH